MATTSTIMKGLRASAASAKPTDHPRADDLLEIGEETLDTLARLLPHLRVLRRAATANRWAGEAVKDALFHLAAHAVFVEMQLEQHEQIKADLGGEGYALLKPNGEGLPYFGDSDYADDPGEDEEGAK